MFDVKLPTKITVYDRSETESSETRANILSQTYNINPLGVWFPTGRTDSQSDAEVPPNGRLPGAAAPFHKAVGDDPVCLSPSTLRRRRFTKVATRCGPMFYHPLEAILI
eukprot:4808988-Pyramimonas_sp.AAC.1